MQARLLAHPDVPLASDKLRRIELFHSCFRGDLDAVKDLIDEGDMDIVNDLRDDGVSLVHLACLSGTLRVVAFLATLPHFDPAVETDVERSTPLHAACGVGCLGIVEFLCGREGVNLDAVDIHGNSIVHRACDSGCVDVLRFLSSVPGVDMWRVTEKGAPIHNAVRDGHLEAIKFLASLPDAKLSEINYAQQTPLHFACLYGKEDIALFLCAQPGVDAFARDRNERTPLHHACLRGQLSVVRALCESAQGADLCNRSVFGDTPVFNACLHAKPTHSASAAGRLETVEYLHALPDTRVTLAEHLRLCELLMPARRLLLAQWAAAKRRRRARWGMAAPASPSWQRTVVERLPRAALAMLLEGLVIKKPRA